MKTIQIHQYTPPQLLVYDNEKKFVGYINHYKEFERLLNDLKNYEVGGYYIVYGTQTINILDYGCMVLNDLRFIQNLYDIHQY